MLLSLLSKRKQSNLLAYMFEAVKGQFNNGKEFTSTNT